MDLLDYLKNRRSVRLYTDDEIGDDVVEDVLDCARLAPTARNAQPWLIGAVRDRSLLGKLGSLADYGGFIAAAGVCFAVFTLRDEKYYLEDGCAATMNVILACGAHGLGTCWVAGDKKAYAEDVRKLLNVLEEYTLVSLVSAGYPSGEAAHKPKKSVEDVSFADRYNV